MTDGEALDPQRFAVGNQYIAALSFNTDKDTTPIVFVHGLFASVNFWHPHQTDVIAENYEWHSLSLPAHYPSQMPGRLEEHHYTPEWFEQIISETLGHLGIEDEIIIGGHSAGAMMALNFAARQPDRVCGVFSINGFTDGDLSGLADDLQQMSRTGPVGHELLRVVMNALTLTPATAKRAARYLVHDRAVLDDNDAFARTLDAALGDMRQHETGGIYDFFEALLDVDITDSMQNITAPVLLIAGEQDPIVPQDHAEAVADAIPNAQFELFNNVGHLSMFEDSERYHNALRDWLQGVECS